MYHLVVFSDASAGTGFSTADSTGYIANEDQMGEDFVSFFSPLVSVQRSRGRRRSGF